MYGFLKVDGVPVPRSFSPPPPPRILPWTIPRGPSPRGPSLCGPFTVDPFPAGPPPWPSPADPPRAVPPPANLPTMNFPLINLPTAWVLAEGMQGSVFTGEFLLFFLHMGGGSFLPFGDHFATFFSLWGPFLHVGNLFAFMEGGSFLGLPPPRQEILAVGAYAQWRSEGIRRPGAT